jgi:heme-degrading monooxygenase HmoA
VPRERFAELDQRFAKRAGKVEVAVAFEGFELLRPGDERDVWLVLTRWRVSTASELWPFDVLERQGRLTRSRQRTIRLGAPREVPRYRQTGLDGPVPTVPQLATGAGRRSSDRPIS